MLKSVIVVFIQIIVIIKKFRLGLGQFSSARSGRAGPSSRGLQPEPLLEMVELSGELEPGESALE